MTKITYLFFDIGGVCLSNGWDHISREQSANLFGYDYAESDNRHYEIVLQFEKGNISRDDYLDEVIFYKKRDFSKKDVIEFMESQSVAHQNSFDVLGKLCSQGNYHISTLNNESLELNEFRIKKFGLSKYFTNFFSSCYLKMKKPEPEIYQAVLRIIQKKGEQCLFVDDREENIEGAKKCGFHTLHLPQVEDLEKLLKEKGILK